MPGQDAGDVAEGLADVHAAAVDGELADFLVVHRAAHLEHGQPRAASRRTSPRSGAG